jgi:hypothetical protein
MAGNDSLKAGETATPAVLALHNNFLSSMTSLKRSLIRSIHYLRIIYDRKVYRALGYGSIADYAARTAGLSRNQTEGFLALGKKLERYPEVKAALGQGELSWSKARVIVSRAASADEAEWIELAKSVSTADLRKLRPVVPNTEKPQPPKMKLEPSRRDQPRQPPPAEEFCYLTLKFTAEEYARWSAILESLRKMGERRSKELLVLAGLDAVGDRPGDAAHGPAYLLHIYRCPECRQASLRNGRGTFAVEPALLEAASCDAVVEKENGLRKARIPPRLRRMVLARAGHQCQAVSCGHTQFLEIHHRVPRAQGGRTELDNLITLCAGCHRELHRREDELREAGRDPL